MTQSSFLFVSNNQKVLGTLEQIVKTFQNNKITISEGSLDETLNTILTLQPDFIFLDFEGNLSSEECLFLKAEILPYINKLPLMVVISETTNYAFKAIKDGFFDYLLKPLRELELRKTILKFKKFQSSQERQLLCLKSYSDYHFVDTDEIMYIKADNNTTDFYLCSGKKISAYKTMKTFQNDLPEYFLRIHNSYIINRSLVSRINFGKSEIYLTSSYGENKIPFSKSYRKAVASLKYFLMDQHLALVN